MFNQFCLPNSQYVKKTFFRLFVFCLLFQFSVTEAREDFDCPKLLKGNAVHSLDGYCFFKRRVEPMKKSLQTPHCETGIIPAGWTNESAMAVVTHCTAAHSECDMSSYEQKIIENNDEAVSVVAQDFSGNMLTCSASAPSKIDRRNPILNSDIKIEHVGLDTGPMTLSQNKNKPTRFKADDGVINFLIHAEDDVQTSFQDKISGVSGLNFADIETSSLTESMILLKRNYVERLESEMLNGTSRSEIIEQIKSAVRKIEDQKNTGFQNQIVKQLTTIESKKESKDGLENLVLEKLKVLKSLQSQIDFRKEVLQKIGDSLFSPDVQVLTLGLEKTDLENQLLDREAAMAEIKNQIKNFHSQIDIQRAQVESQLEDLGLGALNIYEYYTDINDIRWNKIPFLEGLQKMKQQDAKALQADILETEDRIRVLSVEGTEEEKSLVLESEITEREAKIEALEKEILSLNQAPVLRNRQKKIDALASEISGKMDFVNELKISILQQVSQIKQNQSVLEIALTETVQSKKLLIQTLKEEIETLKKDVVSETRVSRVRITNMKTDETTSFTNANIDQTHAPNYQWNVNQHVFSDQKIPVFAKTGLYELQFRIYDKAGNFVDSPEFYIQILPAEVDKSASRISLNDCETTSPLANNKESCKVVFELKDRFANVVTFNSSGLARIKNQSILGRYDLTKTPTTPAMNALVVNGIRFEKCGSLVGYSNGYIQDNVSECAWRTDKQGQMSLHLTSVIPTIRTITGLNGSQLMINEPKPIEFQLFVPNVESDGTVNTSPNLAKRIELNIQTNVFFEPWVKGYLSDQPDNLISFDSVQFSFDSGFDLYAHLTTGRSSLLPKRKLTMMLQGHAPQNISFKNEALATGYEIDFVGKRNQKTQLVEVFFKNRRAVKDTELGFTSKVQLEVNDEGIFRTIVYPGGNLGVRVGAQPLFEKDFEGAVGGSAVSVFGRVLDVFK